MPVRYFVPTTDIFETEDALTVVMEVPGVDREAIDISIENDVLKIEAKIDPSKYDGMEPLYTEYNVGHFARSFTLSNKIDRQQISAKLEDGVLTLTLKKAKEAIAAQNLDRLKQGLERPGRRRMECSITRHSADWPDTSEQDVDDGSFARRADDFARNQPEHQPQENPYNHRHEALQRRKPILL